MKSGKADILKIVSGVYQKENAKEAFEALSHNDGKLAKILIEFGEWKWKKQYFNSERETF